MPRLRFRAGRASPCAQAEEQSASLGAAPPPWATHVLRASALHHGVSDVVDPCSYPANSFVPRVDSSLAAEVSWLATESATLRQMLLELTERLVANEERTAQLLQRYRDELGVDGTPLDDESPATSMRAV